MILDDRMQESTMRRKALNGTLLTVEEAAEHLRLHPSTVYRLARRGELPAVKVGRQWRMDGEALQEWLRANANVRDDRGPE